MFTSLLSELIIQIKIEAVKLQMQICVPVKDQRQKNDILGNVFVEEFDSDTLLNSVKEQIKVLEQIKTLTELKQLFNDWNKTASKIQYDGYGYGSMAKERAAEAFGYIFMVRNVRCHKELFRLIKQK